MQELLSRMTDDCPWRHPNPHYPLQGCGAYYCDLGKPVPPDLPRGMRRPRIIQGGKR
jgi:hypothetical protein